MLSVPKISILMMGGLYFACQEKIGLTALKVVMVVTFILLLIAFTDPFNSASVPVTSGVDSVCPDLYTVQPGDTLSTIATRCNTAVTLILSLNPGIQANGLVVGQQIRLPVNLGRGGRDVVPVTNPNTAMAIPDTGGQQYAYTGVNQYIVQSGDTLSSIASRYVTTLDVLIRMNPQITNPNWIYVNQVIYVPGP